MARFPPFLTLLGVLAPTALAAAQLPVHLRDTGLYARGGAEEIAADVLAFSPQYPLWSDGAEKRRWIRLPAGTRIDMRDPDRWVFPVGTRLWKEFSLGHRLETRMLERTRSGWRFATYVWTEDGSDAVLAPPEGLRGGVPVPGGGRWTIPGTADCRACHEGQPNPVLGFTALQLSSDRDPGALHASTAHAEMHLEDLVARGLVRGLPRALVATPPRIATDSADERSALGYLHANCGICHNRHGPLAGIGLDLLQNLSEGAASVERTRASALAVRALRPVGGAEVRVDPGKPEQMAVTQGPALAGPWMAATVGTMTAWSGPWGISFTANLTPDRETGLGAWAEQNFVDTMRTGRHMGRGRPILPPMPWEMAGKLTDQDLKAVFGYLRTIPAVKNRVPQPFPPPAAPAAPSASAK